MFGHGQGSKCAFWDGSRLQTRTALEMEAAIKRSLSKLYDRLVKLADVECGNASSEDAEAVWHMRNQLQVAARHVRSPTAIAGIAKGLLSELGDPERCLLAPADSLPYIGCVVVTKAGSLTSTALCAPVLIQFVSCQVQGSPGT